MTDAPPRRRSFLSHRLAIPAARHQTLGDSAIAAHLGGADEAAMARRLALIDLSPLPRIGFKGHGAPQWLKRQGLDLPTRPNEASLQADGSLLLRLSEQEHLILAAATLAAKPFDGLVASHQRECPTGVYPLPRQDSHAWLLLTGEASPSCLAKLTAVDIRPDRFAFGDVAQTLMARVSVILARADLAANTGYHVLCDSAAVEYLWDCLIEAMVEFGGLPVGLSAVAR